MDKLADLPVEEIETCLHRGHPFGDETWMLKTAKALSLESALNPRGRPKKKK